MSPKNGFSRFRGSGPLSRTSKARRSQFWASDSEWWGKAAIDQDEFGQMWGEDSPELFRVGDVVKVKDLLHYLPENQSKYPKNEGKILKINNAMGEPTYHVVFPPNSLPAMFTTDELEYVGSGETDPLEDFWNKSSWWR